MKEDIKQALYAQIDQKKLVQNLKELIEKKSVNPFGRPLKDGLGELDAAAYFSQRMRELGMDIRSDTVANGRVNVFGSLRSTGERASLLLAGHLDTVDAAEGAFHATDDGVRVYGRGACDMKAALATYLEVVRVILSSGIALKGDLILGGIADEEFEMIGSRYVNANGPRAGQCIIGEPTELRVCPDNKGQVCLFIRTYGTSVHSSVPEQGVNAIEKMMKAINALTAYHKELRSREPHSLCGTASFCVGVIRGGAVASAVPDFCEIEADRRLLPGETKDTVYRELTEILDAVAAEDSEFRYALSEPTFDVGSNEISPDEPVVQALLDSYVQNTGMERRVYGLPFGTDAPNMGCPTVVCGPGSIVQAHGENEYCDIEQLEKAARIYLSAVLDLLA